MSKTITTIKYSLILLTILALGTIALMAKNANAASYSPYSQPTQNVYDTTDNTNPVPAISSISPSSWNLGGGAKTVTITGSGFSTNSIARYNGSNRPTTFVDYSHLLIDLYPADMYGASGRYITVWNPTPNGGYSNAVLFTINGYVAPNALSNSQAKPATTSHTTTKSSNSTSNTNNNNSGSVEGAQTSQPDNFNSLAGNALFGSNGFMPSGIIQWLLFAIFILLVVIIVRKIFFADKYHSTPLKHS